MNIRIQKLIIVILPLLVSGNARTSFTKQASPSGLRNVSCDKSIVRSGNLNTFSFSSKITIILDINKLYIYIYIFLPIFREPNIKDHIRSHNFPYRFHLQIIPKDNLLREKLWVLPSTH